MMKLKEIKQGLRKRQIPYEQDEDEQRLYIKCCHIGNNRYGYTQRKPKTEYTKYPELEGDKRIIIINCEDCCGCGDW